MARRVICLGAAVLASTAACSWHNTTPGSAPANRVVVAPVNLAIKFDPALEDSRKPIQDEIVRQLQDRPRARVAIIFEPEAHSLWNECLAIVGSSSHLPNTLDTTLEVFAQELVHHADFDLLLVPSLAWRNARVTGRTARWDGVSRRVSVLGKSRSRPDSRKLQGGLAETTGLSLHIAALTPSGRIVHQGWGGLDIVHDVIQGGRRRSGEVELVLRRNPLEEPAHVREGVALALGPYVAAPGP